MASQDGLGVSPAHAAEISAGVRGVLRSTADGDDSGDGELDGERLKRMCGSTPFCFLLFTRLLASFFSCLFSMTASARDVDVAFRRAQVARNRRQLQGLRE